MAEKIMAFTKCKKCGALMNLIGDENLTEFRYVCPNENQKEKRKETNFENKK